MALDLAALCFASTDSARMASFWAGVLGREVGGASWHDGIEVVPSSDLEFPIVFHPGAGPKLGANQIHFDLTSSTPSAQASRVELALSLGGRHLDIGQGPDCEHDVLADPDGNEFDVIPFGNNFLRDTGTIGALCGDGTAAVGYFWASALDWPLVWDQDEETAIQSPRGGSKMSWGGPPLNPSWGRNRLHLELAPAAGSSREVEVERLLGLGASYVDGGLVDPDGNEFCVVDRG